MIGNRTHLSLWAGLALALLAAAPARAAAPGPDAGSEEGRDASTGRADEAGEAVGDPHFRIGVEDVLQIAIWRDPDLSREVPVRPDGKISLPLVQDLTAAGKTPAELAQEIQRRLKEFLSNPSVTVIVKEVNSLKIYLLGEVVRPGPVVMRSKLRLLQAIALAGGLTPYGGKNDILIYRAGRESGKPIEVSYKDVISGKRPADNLVLEAGDTIVVR